MQTVLEPEYLPNRNLDVVFREGARKTGRTQSVKLHKWRKSKKKRKAGSSEKEKSKLNQQARGYPELFHAKIVAWATSSKLPDIN